MGNKSPNRKGNESPNRKGELRTVQIEIGKSKLALKKKMKKNHS